MISATYNISINIYLWCENFIIMLANHRLSLAAKKYYQINSDEDIWMCMVRSVTGCTYINSCINTYKHKDRHAIYKGNIDR